MNIYSGIFWLFLTVYHEARGESPAGQRNVVKVILNRAQAKNWPIENIVRARKQFSCYNDGLSSPKLFIKEIPAMIEVSGNVLDGVKEWEAGDRLEGATHYYAPAGMPDGKPPYWIKGMTRIGKWGNHVFYREG